MIAFPLGLLASIYGMREYWRNYDKWYFIGCSFAAFLCFTSVVNRSIDKNLSVAELRLASDGQHLIGLSNNGSASQFRVDGSVM